MDKFLMSALAAAASAAIGVPAQTVEPRSSGGPAGAHAPGGRSAGNDARGSRTAVYKTVTRQVVDQPATAREIDVPAQQQTLTHTVKVADAKTEWRSFLCEINATPDKLREIQRALQTAGYNPGPIDGVICAQTMRAINDFQLAKGLPVDAYLNLETVKALGVAAN